MGISLTVVMFAYNEAENIGPVVEDTVSSLEEWLGGDLEDYELVLVNDGSTDNTAAVMDALAASNPRIVPKTHETNQGIGVAVKTGFAAATKDYISILPADGQVTYTELKKLIPGILDGADMVVGYYTQRGVIDGGFRLFLSKGLRFVMNMALGTQRPMDGVYMFRRSLLERLPLKSDTFFVNLELPVRAIRENLDVRSVPVEVHERLSGKSKVVGFGRIMKVGTEVLKFRKNIIMERFEGSD